jgi:hypothetical protein
MGKIKQQPPPPPPPTYPARPINGGRLEEAWKVDEKDPEEWRYRPKYNGRRVLVHIPTLRTWNRQLEENNWGTFPAFKLLKELIETSDLWPPVLEWVDVEFLYGKTSIGKGSIVVLDYVSANEVWWDRMMNLNMAFGEQNLTDLGQPRENEVYFARPINKLPTEVLQTWADMQEQNKKWGATFYEGLVAYEMRSKYPIQLFNPSRETRHWIKHRFID